MITRIREVRRARRMTLDEVAKACTPPTTPQTIGRLETGTRTVSVGWLNRIAAALGVEASDLVDSPDKAELPVVAVLGAAGASAPRRNGIVVPPKAGAGQVAMTVTSSLGDYRAGDEIWCEQLGPEDFGKALNRDVLVPRPAGRFQFGRLIGRDASAGDSGGGGKLHLLPPGAGSRQSVVTDPPWIAVATKLVRGL
ncbi:helix-turn-helix transcriptional regulator [Sphingomonas sp.]|uniref:helix-turn-helix domain-containing protein n=1 Tax=Sphingomonas sp. TaxID=28214 RepID=UPI00325FBC5B